MKDRKIYAGKYLSLVVRDGWEYIERVNCDGVVIIVSKTDDDKIIFVEQFRRPVQRQVIGFPAGLVGDDRGTRGESFAEAAKREMVEETGYLPRKIKTLFVGPVSAGMCKDMVTIVHASGLKKVGPGGGIDDLEDIKVHEVPLRTVDAWIKRQQKKGLLVAPNVFTGIYFLKNWIK
ncbi:MAG: NUDIX hydrolase [Candidatus Omnitrophica bacterium]|nr:NUDIX hydrolase [Candidatus Omnitrophota bacterium]